MSEPSVGETYRTPSGEIKVRRIRRHYTDEFKLQMVQLVKAGNPQAKVTEEYDLTPSALSRWISEYDSTGTFKSDSNLDPKDYEIGKLRKENYQLKQEVEILKHAALILGQKTRSL